MEADAHARSEASFDAKKLDFHGDFFLNTQH
jgi:hypothetical protein